MGAKNPSIDKQTKPVMNKTCEKCNRDFVTVAAFKAHTMAKHPEIFKQMQSHQAERNDGKTAFITPISRTSKRLQKKQPEEMDININVSSSNDSDKKKTVFECPECLKQFQVYFSASKHIQNRHGLDDTGKPISADSLIKPIRKEMCIVCLKIIDGTHHLCDNYLFGVGESFVNGIYCCLGCERNFLSVSAFDNHIPGSHSDDVDSMFFPDNTDFQKWKCDMESQVKAKYLTLTNASNKEYYQCNYVSPKNSAAVTHLCPSVLIVTEFPKGTQVHYYRKHAEHSCEYKIPPSFEQYILKPQLAVVDAKSEDDLYSKVKDLLDDVIVGSAKVNVTHLKKLYEMALDMQVFLNSYDEENDDTDTALQMQSYITVKKSVSIVHGNEDEENIYKQPVEKTSHIEIATMNNSIPSDQITKVLETPRVSARLKRKSESFTPDAKKQKVESDEKVNEEASEIKSCLKENNPIPKNSKIDSPTVTKAPAMNQSPSFNDSYKQFIDNTFITPSNKKSSPSLKRAHNKKEIVKTKIGQFIPSPKKATHPIKVNSENVINNINLNVAEEKELNKSLNISFESKGTAKKKELKKTHDISFESKAPVTKKDSNKKLNISVESKATAKKKESNKTLITNVDNNMDTAKKKELNKAVSTNVDKNMDTAKKKESNKSVSSSEDNKAISKKKVSSKAPKTSIADLNIKDFKYEVVEQENDCNILVLKI